MPCSHAPSAGRNLEAIERLRKHEIETRKHEIKTRIPMLEQRAQELEYNSAHRSTMLMQVEAQRELDADQKRAFRQVQNPEQRRIQELEQRIRTLEQDPAHQEKNAAQSLARACGWP